MDRGQIMKGGGQQAIAHRDAGGRADQVQPPAKELAATQNNIEIEPGMTEEQVTQKLGQPLQAIKFGDQKTLKYNGMTIVLKEGKVVDLKIE